MFEIGFGEMTLVALVGLLVLGPERLPRVARTAGLWIRKGRSMRAALLEQIDREVELEELRYSLRQKNERLASRDLDQLTRDALAAFSTEAPEPSGSADSAATAEPARVTAAPS